MANNRLPNVNDLRQVLRLCPDTGEMIWKDRDASWFSDGVRISAQDRAKLWNAKHAGKPALSTVTTRGYKYGMILGVRVMAHRVVFALHHGRWPEGEIDHINRNKQDNRISNLRECDRTTNNRNRAKARGVHRRPGDGPRPWRAYIGVDGQQLRLGSFASKEEASKARVEAESHFGYPI